MHQKSSERYFFFGLLVAAVVLAFFVFRPFLIIIILGACFAVVLRPVFRALRKIKFPPWLAALITAILFIILICGPLFGIIVLVFNQAQALYSSLVHGGGLASLSSLNTSLQKFLPEGVNLNLPQRANDLVSVFVNNIGAIFSTTLYTVFSLVLIVLALFYFLKDGAEWRDSMIALSPLSKEDNEKILNRMASAINGVLKGYLLVAIMQGIVMGAGFYLFGLPNPALWGVLTSVAALIPTPGTGLVAVPAIIYMFATGNTPGAIGMIIWYIAQMLLMDDFLSPKIVGRKVNLPPFLILFSVLGGIALFGPVGILIGPLSVSLLYVLVSIYRTEFQLSQEPVSK